MSKVTFGQLSDLPLREAWEHEASDFTPWLSENIEYLSDAIGIPLELTGQEVRVETFAADFLARNLDDDSIVLVENQLEVTDHKHLGQIMTYLAGLEARTVIWIASQFREPHLSAIRWLNQHTTERFSFFAVKLRVVRIGDSPVAPIFEVIEQPNDWDRDIKDKVSKEGATYYDEKQRFWATLLERHPHLADLGFRAWRYSNNYVELYDDPVIQISVWFGKASCGVFVRGAWGEAIEPVLETLEPHRERLESELGASLDPSGRGSHLLVQEFSKGMQDESAWPDIMDWMEKMVAEYKAALSVLD